MSAQPLGQQRWLPTNEFITLAKIPLRTFRLKKSQGAYITRKRGKVLEISAASLPPSALVALAPVAPPAAVKTPPSASCPAHTDSACGPLFAAAALAGAEVAGAGRRITLPKEAEAEAHKRLTILQPLLDFCDHPEDRSRFLQLRLKSGATVANSNDMAQYLFETHGTPAATLWRWKRSYKTHGLAGLARKVREDKGRAKWAEEFPTAAQLAVATYLQPWQTKQTAYEALVRESRKLGMAAHQLPSYGSVCNYLATIPAAAAVLTREGTRQHNERMSNSLRRGYTDILANQWWVADTMLHDVLVRDDVFNRDDAAIRPQFTAIMDLRSRKFVGYSWCLNGSSRSIGSALRMAVKRFGPAENFYCDNGKDYKKVARNASAANARPENADESFAVEMAEIGRLGVLGLLGIKVAYAIPFRPQSKPIERAFRTLHLKLDAILPGYTTGNAYARPDNTVAAAAQHAKVVQIGQPERSPLIPMSEFIQLATQWIEEDYNANHRHSGAGMNDRTPNDVFASCLAPQRPVDLSVLDTLLWERKEVYVRNSGFQINKRRYIGDSMTAEHVLYMNNERELLFCFDPNEPNAGIVTDLDGHKLCEVRAQGYAPQGVAAAPFIADSLQRSNGTRRNTIESVRALRKQVSAGGFTTAAQDLRHRALESQPQYLPIAVNDSVTQRVIAPAEAAASPNRPTTQQIIDRAKALRSQRQ